jgi:predicted nucleotidyltransferase
MEDMHIDRKDMIAGLPALDVRRLLRRHFDYGWFTESAARTLGVSRDRADEILLRLEREGFIRRRKSHSSETVWEVELKGRRLAKAGAGPKYLRATAERHLKAFEQRVLELRERDDLLHRVSRVILFGSFLDETLDRVSDVDLALELQFKEQNTKKAFALSQIYAQKALERGRTFRTYVDQLFAAKTDALSFLKARSPILQFTDVEDPILDLAPTKLIYEASTSEPSDS